MNHQVLRTRIVACSDCLFSRATGASLAFHCLYCSSSSIGESMALPPRAVVRATPAQARNHELRHGPCLLPVAHAAAGTPVAGGRAAAAPTSLWRIDACERAAASSWHAFGRTASLSGFQRCKCGCRIFRSSATASPTQRISFHSSIDMSTIAHPCFSSSRCLRCNGPSSSRVLVT